MPNLDYLRWEWKQYWDVWYFEPGRMTALYLTVIFLGLMVLHTTQLYLSERNGPRNKPLRRKLYWDAVIFTLSLYAASAQVFDLES